MSLNKLQSALTSKLFSGPLCPPGFISFEESSDCFFFTDRHSVTQEEGQRRCAALGATLAEVREGSMLSNLKAWAGNKKLWTGITDKSEVGATL